MEKQDIVKLTKQIITSPTPGTYLCFGGEEFLKRRFVSDLKHAVIPSDVEDLNYSVVSGPDQADRILELAYTLPQFSDSRMIVWYGSGYPLTQQRFRKKTEEVVSAVSGFPYLYLIIYASADELDPQSKEGRDALSKLDVTKLDFQKLSAQRVQRWVMRHFEAEGVGIDENNVSYLIKRCGTGMTELSSAVSKLSAYAAETGLSAVGAEQIDLLIPQNTEYSAFFISDSIRRRDVAGLLAYINDAKARAEKPQMIMAAIFAEAEKLCRIKLAQKSGMTYSTASKQLGINEYVVKLAYAYVGEVTEKRCFRFLQACAEADKTVKSTSSDGWGVLTALACSL